MKKILIIIAVIISILCINKKDEVIIPSNAIRFRVISSSNTIEDQTIKNKVSKNIQEKIYELTKNSSSYIETKKVLDTNYEYLKDSIEEELKSNNVSYDYRLNIGRNYFPSKQYKGIKYDAGYYDSVTIELGNHEGLNWWCIIYPPLCLIDEDTSDVEYTTLARELIDNVKK
ncbi:MAG: stage II sporulation protein R [Bacilli bacterium]|nr:stage II sporulation protein R [Bacilli bacterium]